MTEIELLNPGAHPDGWHDVRSPGGYEWWYFDAEDTATDTQVVAIFMQGFIFHPGYLRAYERFRRDPTRHRPPVAGEFPCAYLCVYRGGKILKQFFTQYRSDAFRASADRCEVHVGGENSVIEDGAGTYQLSMAGTPWHLTGRGPVRELGQTLLARFRFVARPTRPGRVEGREFLSAAMTGAEHRWSIPAPRCDVTGTIEVAGQSIDFRGIGYHDHNYGTAPIGDGLARWTWGRAFFGDDRVMTFHYPEPSEPGRPHPGFRTGDGPALIAAREIHLVEARAGVTRDVVVDRVTADWSLICNAAIRLRYPRSLDFGPALRLSEPRVIDPSPFYLRLQFKAESFGERATAFCEVAYPYRVRWPLLGRMIEMSFDKRVR